MIYLLVHLINKVNVRVFVL